MAEQASNGVKPDAFKAMMAEAKAAGRPELAGQSLGRSLSDAESQFADALMSIYEEGTSGADAIAQALLDKDVRRPSTGVSDWTPQILEAELVALNADLDEAYQTNGFGA